MVANIDDNGGLLLARLDALGLARNTLVVFMNDNGGTVGVPVFNAGMRGQKVTPWSCAAWPPTTTRGETPCNLAMTPATKK